MSFDYEVLSEEEALKAREFPLLADGIYDFSVIESKLGYSSNGNAMIKLKIRIIHDGIEFHVFDNLIATKNMIWKTKHFCDSTGLEKEYAAKQFSDAVCQNRRGTCEIGNVEARPKMNGTNEMWKAKNEVKDYLSQDALNKKQTENPFAPAQQKETLFESEPFHDDSIPF